MPNWKFSNLPYTQIEAESSPFNWFPGSLNENSHNSMNQNGLLLPLLVQSMPDQTYQIIDGFKRFSYLVTQNELLTYEKRRQEFPCMIIPESLSIKQVFKIRLQTLSQENSNFSAIHICKLLKKLLDLDFERNEIVQDFLPQLRLKSSPRLLKQLLDLEQNLFEQKYYDRWIRSEFIKRLSCEDLLPLLRFSKKELIPVIDLAQKTEIQGKKWQKIVIVLDEVCRLNKVSAKDILNSPEILGILKRTELQPNIRYNLLKNKLDTLRYPELSSLRQKFDLRKKHLKFENRISLESDPFFEDEDLTLIIKFGSYEELQTHLKYLKNGNSKISKENLEELWKDLFRVFQED